MTIASSSNKNLYVGPTGQAVFPYTFIVWHAADLRVVRRSATGVEIPLVLDTDFTVSGVGAANGGNVTLAAPLAEGEYLLVKRIIDAVQETDLVENAATPAKVMEGTFDRVVAMIQQLGEAQDRAISMPETATPDEIVNVVNLSQAVAESKTARDEAIHAAETVGKAAVFAPGWPGSTNRSWLSKASDIVSVCDFGAVGDGDFENATAFQRAIDHVRSLPNGGKVVLPAGSYKLSASIDCFPVTPLEIEWMEGAIVLCALPGADAVLFQGTNADSPTTRGCSLVFTNPKIKFHDDFPSSAVGAVLIEKRYASEFRLNGFGRILHYHGNTAVRLSNLWNCVLNPCMVWGGGVQKIWKDTGFTTFSIDFGSTELISDTPIFDSNDVGKYIHVSTQIFLITSCVDNQHVIVGSPSKIGIVNMRGSFEYARVSVESGSNIANFSCDCLKSSDIGRVVYIPASDSSSYYVGSVNMTRAKILNIISSKQAEIDTSPNTTVSNVPAIFSPSVELYSEGESLQHINDVVSYKMHIEQFCGTGLIVQNASRICFRELKCHANNGSYNYGGSSFCAILSSVHGNISGNFEGEVTTELAPIWVMAGKSYLGIDSLVGNLHHGQHVLYSSFNSPAFVCRVGDITILNELHSDTLMYDAVYGDGTGELYWDGYVSCAMSTYAGPVVHKRKRVFGKKASLGLLNGQVNVVSDSNATLLAITASGSPRFAGIGIGGTVNNPVATGDYQPIQQIIGHGLTQNGNIVDCAAMTYTARNPLGDALTGHIKFSLRNGTSGSDTLGLNPGALWPMTDNTLLLGVYGFRWKEIFCASAVINSSDAREKESSEIDEAIFRAWSRVEYKKFKFTEAIESKGEDKARLHFGLLAQQVAAAFEAEGLDPFAYGLLCYDEWPEQPERRDGDGNIVEEYRPAGNSYGIRYTEALALECAYLRWRLGKIAEA